MADGAGWTPEQLELRNALLEEVSYALGEALGSHQGVRVTLTVLQTLERLRWAKQRPEDAGKLEYGQLYAGGSFLMFNDTPEVLKTVSIADQIKMAQQFGGKVGRRRVVVLQDWKILRKGAKS